MKTANPTRILTALAVMLLTSQIGWSQCKTWLDDPMKEQAENAHTIYRQALKDGDMVLAFENWEKAYEIAPAADGRRDFHYTDGAKLYLDKVKKDPDNKAEYAAMIDKLYNQAAECYISGAISVPKCTGDHCGKQRAGRILGRYGYAMVYELRSPLSESFEVFQRAIELAGNTSEYSVMDPYTYVVVNQFQRGEVDAEEARRIHQELNDLADYNIENNQKFGETFAQAKASMNAKWAPIEADIFDCAYFKAKYEPMYKENPDDLENLKVIYATLVKRGCEDSDPLVAEIKSKYETLAASKNAEIQAQFEKDNPGVLANRLYKSGDYEGAVMNYTKALDQETDPEKKASYHYSLASIQFRKLNKYSDARKSARAALELRPDWGDPLMLIGDMYAKSSNSCGDDAYSRGLVVLAAIDKWRAAKANDPSVAEDAQSKINKYSGYIPPSEDIFMRNDVKEGDRVSTGCWVSESVTVRGK